MEGDVFITDQERRCLEKLEDKKLRKKAGVATDNTLLSAILPSIDASDRHINLYVVKKSR